MGVLPSSQSQGTNMDCFTSWYPFPSAVDKPAIRLQPLNPHHHWSCWRPLGHPTPAWGSRSSTYLDLPRDLVPGKWSCLSLRIHYFRGPRWPTCLVPCPSRTWGLLSGFPGGPPASGHTLSLSFSPFPGLWPPSTVLCYIRYW